MDTASKETVIVVHGTWASPEPSVTQWYQLPDNPLDSKSFTARLNEALAQRGSSASCWAHCCDEFPLFKWSGENRWVERMHAASDLRAYVDALQSRGWRCHIVAHSHGGNIAIDAFADRLNSSEHIKAQGKIVTLGTPFMNCIGPIKKSNESIKYTLNVAPLLLIFVGLALLAYYFFYTNNIKHYIGHSYIGVFIIMIIISIMAFVIWQMVTGDQESVRRTYPEKSPVILSIGSLRDEVWQVLHHLTAAINPLVIPKRLVAYLTESFHQWKHLNSNLSKTYNEYEWKDCDSNDRRLIIFLYIIDACRLLVIAALMFWDFESSRQQNNPLAVGAICLVVILLPNAVLAMKGYQLSSAYLGFYRSVLSFGEFCLFFAPLLSANYYFRPTAWLLLKKTAMGLEGYNFALPSVEQVPTYIAKGSVRYENLPKSVERRALDRRRAWLMRHFSDVTDTFAKMTITAADLAELLREIEVDQSLVHGAYYMDDECIALIADWISNRDSCLATQS